MFCPYCGNQIPDDARFCRHCGHMIEEAGDYQTEVFTQTPAHEHWENADRQARRRNHDPDDMQTEVFTNTPPYGQRQADYGQRPAGYGQQPYYPPEPPKKGMSTAVKVLIGVLCALLIAGGAFAATYLIMHHHKNPGGSAGNNGKPGSVTTSGGKEVKAMARPSFFDAVEMEDTSAIKAAVTSYEVKADLSNVSNAKDVVVPDNGKSTLAKNGFYINGGTGFDEFYELYESNRYALEPNFITVDSMMHTYHLYFTHLLKNLERGKLSEEIATLSVKMAEKSLAQYEDLKGSEWEDAALRNCAFFAVGAKLLDQPVNVPSEAQSLVDQELALISAEKGIDPSPLFNYGDAATDEDNKEDYSQYKPRGYYAGEEALEKYFRAMMWYGRMNYTQSNEGLDRSAMLITMALDDDTLPLWEGAYSVTSFFAGASDDCGYYEYKPIIDAVYGENATASDLAGAEDKWKEYHSLTAKMPAPQINSVVVMEDDDANHEEEVKGYRFMGQRFSIDAAIMQNLVYNIVKKTADGEQRMMPNALDVPAALGSDAALDILKDKGETRFPNYEEQMNKMREKVNEGGDALWQASLSSQWLYTLTPLLDKKGEGYPKAMQSNAWQRKNLQSFLGSYTELKHDTVLYAKQVMVEMGGGPIEDKDDRGYVEPEPEVFARLSALTEATINGLEEYGLLDSADKKDLELLKKLSDQLLSISKKELAEEKLTDDEYDLIRTFGGQLEHLWDDAMADEGDDPDPQQFPAALVTDIATDPNGKVLEIGTGSVKRMYVIVPIDGSLHVVSGPVFSFYQFEHPLSDRLTDQKWREMMGIGTYSGDTSQKKPPEDWTNDFMIEEVW